MSANFQAVKKTMGSNNFEEELVKEIIKLVDVPFPDGRLQLVMNLFIKKFVPFTLIKLCRMEKCCFVGPLPSQQEASYPYQKSGEARYQQQYAAQPRGKPQYQYQYRQ